MEFPDTQFDQTVANRLRTLRSERGLTLDRLAELSGVSRAMISRIERGEASPTAALLARLCSALGLSLSSFFEADAADGSPLSTRDAQALWRDPESGYLRRSVSPPRTGSRVDIVEVEFPPGAAVRFPGQQASRVQWQHVWVFAGEIEMRVGEGTYRLQQGDCLYMNVGDVHAFSNPTDQTARYAVIIDLGTR